MGLNPAKDTYGKILATSPKAAWRNVDLLTPLKNACQGESSIPLVCTVETDVNAPALAELQAYNNTISSSSKTKQQQRPISSLAYITVGTGVGLGLVIHNRAVHGRMHPEGGHVCVQPLHNDTFGGYSWGKDCNPYASVNTVESLASSVALTERLEHIQGVSQLPRNVLASLPDDHEIWPHAANALANLCVTLLLTTSVERIVLGGGLLRRNSLLPRIQKRTIELMNGYVSLPPLHRMSEELITTSQYGDDIGLIGAMVLGQASLSSNDSSSTSSTSDAATMKEKQTAFRVGLWHGVIVGAVVTGCMVKWMGGSLSRRSR